MTLATKLFVILAGAAVVGLGVRRLVGPAAIEEQQAKIDGLNAIVLLVFVAAVMQSAGGQVASCN